MHIKTVSYSKTFPLAAYSNERIGVEFELEKGESADKALANAKELVDEFHRKNNPQLFDKPELLPQEEKVISVNNDNPKSKEDGYIFLIQNATTEKELKTYEPLSKKYPKIKEAYNIKYKELTNERT